ncbi:hypothetical protein V6N12_044047 [Hibiscus sabdariffa]|uniref:Fe2OG dioxygenase domain-containing protein n=1 Tax=Hibiscus sabdariffa TaxID=183260 RepID=A0ABR2DG39_9ROSI
MEAKVQSFISVGSLPVQNVQALASKNLKNIPSRYIRPEVEFDAASADESQQIPVIDMSKIDHDDEQKKLHFACKDWGFFQEFFNLPLEEKMVCAQIPNHIEGYGQAFVVSEEQKLDWGDMLFLLGQPVSLRNMRFWPTNPPSFRANFEKYLMELNKVKIHLIKLIAKNLGTDPEMLLSLFEDGTHTVRLNYYPPCAEASKVFGVAPHSDATGLTLLLQVNEVEGLQIKRNEKWVPVKPIPGALVTNIGDMMELT